MKTGVQVFILNPVAIPVRLVVEVGPSRHQAVQPKPGSPAPKLGVKPSCQTNPHSFHLLANQIVNICNVPASNSPYIYHHRQHFLTLPRQGFLQSASRSPKRRPSIGRELLRCKNSPPGQQEANIGNKSHPFAICGVQRFRRYAEESTH